MFKDEELKKYKAVIFLSTTGDALNDEQQAAFERYIKAGGGFVGIHAAADTEYGWPWYTKMVGHMFPHPSLGADRDHQGREIPTSRAWIASRKRFLATEEWYEYDAARSKVHYLLSRRESTYKPEANWGAKSGKGMASSIDRVRYQEYDGGRAFYTGLGHLPGTWSDTNFLHHVYGGHLLGGDGHWIHGQLSQYKYAAPAAEALLFVRSPSTPRALLLFAIGSDRQCVASAAERYPRAKAVAHARVGLT
jgi:type 1 glutamine amidotransferase